MVFLGYPRPNGSYGVRNYVLVIPGGFHADEICHFVQGTRTILTGNTPVLRSSRDRETFFRLYTGLALNPNVAAVIVNGAAEGLDYPEVKPELLVEEISDSGKRVELLMPGHGDTLDYVARGVRLAREMVQEASKIRREPCSDEHLTLGVKCGSSDPTSGIAGNPVIGEVYDKLIEAGGTAFFGESTEVIGAENILAKRAVDSHVGREILKAAFDAEERAKATGEDVRTINPVPANIKAGISTLEEKSLGAIHKSGSRPISGVLKYAERPRAHGLYFVDNSAWTLSIFMGYAASGAQLVLYQLGGGGYAGDGIFYRTGSVVAPLIWCSANPKTEAVGGWNLDFYCGTVIEGEETIDEAAGRLYQLILDTASGTMTKTETLTHIDPNEVLTREPEF